jgi:hypothetical protein
MMQHPSAYDEIEVAADLADIHQIAIEQAQVRQRVLVLQKSLVAQACFGEVDANHLAVAVGERKPRRLHGSAAGHENRELVARAPFRPKHRRPQAWIAHLVAAFRDCRPKIERRGRIGMALVLARNQDRNIFHDVSDTAIARAPPVSRAPSGGFKPHRLKSLPWVK